MKLLTSLALLVAIAVAVAWFGYKIPPKALYYKAVNAITSTSSTVSKGSSDVGKAGSRFSEVIKNNYNSQDMTVQNPK